MVAVKEVKLPRRVGLSLIAARPLMGTSVTVTVVEATIGPARLVAVTTVV